MDQAIVKPNEFIVKLLFDDSGLHITAINPHRNIGQSQEYDHGAWLMLTACLKFLETMPISNLSNDNESRP